MRVERMREAIINHYGPVIHNRYVYEMSDAQILAIYHSMINRGVVTKSKAPKKYCLHDPVKYEQLRMEI